MCNETIRGEIPPGTTIKIVQSETGGDLGLPFQQGALVLLMLEEADATEDGGYGIVIEAGEGAVGWAWKGDNGLYDPPGFASFATVPEEEVSP